MEEPGGLLSMGSHRVGHDWSDLAAAAILWEEADDIASKALKESLMNPPALGHLKDHIFFSLLAYEKEEVCVCLGVHALKHRENHWPTGYDSQQLQPVPMGYPLCHWSYCPFGSVQFSQFSRSVVSDSLGKGYQKNPYEILNHFCAFCSRSPPEFSSHSTFLSQLSHFPWSPFVNCSLHNSFTL